MRETGIFLSSLPDDFQICAFRKEDRLISVAAWTKKKIHILSYDYDCTFVQRNIHRKEFIDKEKYAQELAFPAKKAVIIGYDDENVQFLLDNSYEIVFASTKNCCVASERFLVLMHSSFAGKKTDHN